MDVQRRLLSSAKGRFVERMEALDVSGALKDVMGNIYAVCLSCCFLFLGTSG